VSGTTAPNGAATISIMVFGGPLLGDPDRLCPLELRAPLTHHDICWVRGVRDAPPLTSSYVQKPKSPLAPPWKARCYAFRARPAQAVPTQLVAGVGRNFAEVTRTHLASMRRTVSRVPNVATRRVRRADTATKLTVARVPREKGQFAAGLR